MVNRDTIDDLMPVFNGLRNEARKRVRTAYFQMRQVEKQRPYDAMHAALADELGITFEVACQSGAEEYEDALAAQEAYDAILQEG